MAKKPPTLWKTPAAEALRWQCGTDLAALDHGSTPGRTGKKRAGERLLAERAPELADLQERLFAHGRTGGDRSVLLVLQGMDTAGKGGIARHVVGLVDPGYLGVFDRSHHEQVLVVRVDGLEPEDTWRQHYDELNEFEAQVAASGILIVKVALFVSADEQKERLAERLDRPDKHWKYDPGDIDAHEAPGVPGGVPGAAGPHHHRGSALVCRAGEPEVVPAPGLHGTADRRPAVAGPELAARHLRRAGGKGSPGGELSLVRRACGPLPRGRPGGTAPGSTSCGTRRRASPA